MQEHIFHVLDFKNGGVNFSIYFVKQKCKTKVCQKSKVTNLTLPILVVLRVLNVSPKHDSFISAALLLLIEVD